MAAQIPPTKNWLNTHPTSFVDVNIGPDQGINTVQFLDAAESTTSLFDILGSVAFTPVKNDMVGNIKKVRDRYNASKNTSETLQQLVKSEIASKAHKATEGLLWLMRALDFTAQALRNDLTANAGVTMTDAKPKKELAETFRAAYKNTLALHHGFMVKPIFSAAMGAAPYRKDFMPKLLGPGASPDTLVQDWEQWVAALEERISILKAFYETPAAKWY